MKILTIPPKCTPYAQPLDRFFFRQYKAFVRRIEDFVLLDNIDLNLNYRNEIIKRQSLTHTQFSAPIFLDYRRFSWHKCRYTDTYTPFTDPVKYCFDVNVSAELCSKCENTAFLKCAHCQALLCFYHFYYEYHYH